MTDVLVGLPPWLVPLAVSLVVLAEPAFLVGVVLPSVASAVLLGFVSGLEVLPLWAAALVVGGAAVTGDALAFRAGRGHRPEARGRPGRPRGTRIGRALEAGERRAEALVDRHGGPAVALARWMTVARTVVPRLAGSSGMTWRHYLALAVPSALLWGAALTGAGYVVGASYAEVSRYVGRGGGALLLLALAAGGVVALGSWAGRHPGLVRALADRLTAMPPLRTLDRHVPRAAERRVMAVAAAAVVVAALLAVAALLYGVTWAALHWSGLTAGDRWLAGQLSGPGREGLTDAAWLVVGLLRSTYVFLLVGILSVALCWARHAGRPAGGAAARLPVLAGSLVPLATLAAAGALAGTLAPAPTDPAVEDWVLGAQVPVVTAALVLLAGLLTRGGPWAVRAAAGTVALLLALLLTAARVYLGWEPLSSGLTSLLVGAAWGLLLLAASRSTPSALPGPRPAPPLGVAA